MASLQQAIRFSTKPEQGRRSILSGIAILMDSKSTPPRANCGRQNLVRAVAMKSILFTLATIMAGLLLLTASSIAVPKWAKAFSKKQAWRNLFTIGTLSYRRGVFVFTMAMPYRNGKIICLLLH